jgi:hypothetical protein
MARVRPFKALRYAPSLGDPSRRLGYPDQLNVGDVRTRSAAEPFHPLQLVEATDPAALLQKWQAGGQLVASGPALYVVELQSVAGGPSAPRKPPVHLLLGAVEGDGWTSLEDEAPRAGGPTQAPALALAADDHAVFRGLLGEATRAVPAELELRSADSVIRLWRVEERGWISRLQGALEEAPVRPLAQVPADGPTLAAILPLSDPGVTFRPIHRGVQHLPNFNRDTFLALVAKYARVYDLEQSLKTPQGLAAARERLGSISSGQHAVLLVLPGGEGKVLRFRQALDLEHIRAVPKNPTLRSLDLALLNALVLRTVLGIQEPHTLGHPQVFPVDSLDALVEQVDRGLFQVGFGLNPPPVWELRAVMEAHQSLPPRTLAVEPNPPMGLLFLGE